MKYLQTGRQHRLALFLPIFLLTQVGCSTLSNGEKGALAGGAIGTGLGAVVGATTGNPKTGAVVGGLLGGGVGAIVGNDVDRQEARDAAVRQASNDRAYADAQPNRIWEVVDLVKQGHDERTIINHIRKNRMTFDLSIADLKTLKDNGVPPAVINEMQTGGSVPVAGVPGRPRTVVVREQVLVPAYDPYWGPPPVIYARPPRPVVTIGYGRHW